MSTIPETSPNALNVNLLLATFLKIEPQADEFASSFYRILFDKYPQIRRLFATTDMAKQKNKLIESLQLVMVNVRDTEAFTSILKNLGKRHVQYGAVLTDYPLIGDALLQALEKHLNKDWNAEVQQTWTIAYQMIADTMAEGARAASENNVNWISMPPQSSATAEAGSLPDRLESNSQNNDSIDPSSSSKSVLVKLMLLTSLGIAGVCGYMAWNTMQTPTNPSVTTPAKQDR
jgi:hemoglobin-like flavoprotein